MAVQVAMAILQRQALILVAVAVQVLARQQLVATAVLAQQRPAQAVRMRQVAVRAAQVVRVLV
jgi:hypothetical protein